MVQLKAAASFFIFLFVVSVGASDHFDLNSLQNMTRIRDLSRPDPNAPLYSAMMLLTPHGPIISTSFEVPDTPIFAKGPLADELILNSFVDEEYVLIPEGQKIETAHDDHLQESWNYPTGTTLVHVIYWDSIPRRIFEIRTIEKTTSSWAFKSYRELGITGKMNLIFDSEKFETFDFTHSDGTSAQAIYKRISTQGCQFCHWNHSLVSYPTLDLAGPCGFTPTNPEIPVWREKLKTSLGYDPLPN